MPDPTFSNLLIDQDPLVSVLVPAYNHEKYIIECLESIKNLSYKNIELLVSDDCSPDNTFKLTEEWAKRNAGRFERALTIQQETNGGLVANLQFLFNNARGVYLICIASDDLFVESAIERRLKVLQKNRNLDAVFGNAIHISADGVVLRDEYIPQRYARELSSSRLMVSSFVLHFSAPGPVMMLRRKAILKDGSLGVLPIDLKIEDNYIYLLLAARGKLQFINEVVAKYREVPGSLNTALSNVRVVQTIKTYERIKPLLSGFSRFVMNNRLNRYRLEINRDKVAFYGLRKFVSRTVLVFLNFILLAGSLVSGLNSGEVE